MPICLVFFISILTSKHGITNSVKDRLRNKYSNISVAKIWDSTNFVVSSDSVKNNYGTS